jgi:penicillin-binding protein 1A
VRVTPRFFDLVTRTTGELVEDLRALPPGPQVLSPEVAYVTVHLMKQVVERGTAKQAQAIGRPAAGKTGTSASYRDVWFIGFTTDLVAGVWIGRDDSKPIGDKITGGGVAVPIWVDFMQKAHPRTPVRDFDVPAGISFARVDPLSGDPASPSAHSRWNEPVWAPFVRGTMPQKLIGEPPVRAFDDLVAPPTVPPPPRCTSLSCL